MSGSASSAVGLTSVADEFLTPASPSGRLALPQTAAAVRDPVVPEFDAVAGLWDFAAAVGDSVALEVDAVAGAHDFAPAVGDPLALEVDALAGAQDFAAAVGDPDALEFDAVAGECDFASAVGDHSEFLGAAAALATAVVPSVTESTLNEIWNQAVTVKMWLSYN